MPELSEIVIEDLGCLGYEAAMRQQRQIHAQVLSGERPGTVLLLEHEPVITISKRRDAPAHLLVGAETLKAEGIEVCRTDRGGDITFHGPGQLVAYPIVRLTEGVWSVRRFVRALEQIMVATVSRWGVAAHGGQEAVGIWVDEAKLGAVGIRVERRITMHGLALNVTTRLDHFRFIRPCGLDRPVTSLSHLLKEECPSMVQVKMALADETRRVLSGP